LLCETLEARLLRDGHEAVSAHTLTKGREKAADGMFDIIFLDVRMPDGNGLLAIEELRVIPSAPEIIIMTGQGDPDGAELAVKSGAWGYLEKPGIVKEMMLPLSRALEYRQEKIKAGQTQPVVIKRDKIIGQSRDIIKCLEQVAQAAGSDVTTLVMGETGTGKELFARAIHENSSRAKRNFVTVDCAALPENLVESILFGHSKGSFTGADKDRKGLIHKADNGTLFLDEVGEMGLGIQKSFLRVLQEKMYRPVGAAHEYSSNFRLIAATNKDLDKMVAAGAFRKDLLFRLRSFTIILPPLRSHKEDIRHLVNHFLDQLSLKHNIETKGTSPEFFDALQLHDWQGNVRELSQVTEQAFTMALHTPTLFINHLPDYIRIPAARAVFEKTSPKSPSAAAVNVLEDLPDWRTFKEDMEFSYLRELMDQAGGKIPQACRMSGFSRARLYELLKKHNLLPGKK